MPLITETYYLSLTQDNRGILRLRCSQDDTLRTVNLKLYNNGSIFVIPSGISASVSGVKQNGAVFSKSCTISQDRESVVLQLSSDITNVDGIIVAEIVLNDGEGGRLGTSNFIIQVEKNPIRAGVVQDTETPIEYISDFIDKIQTLTARLNNLITPSGDPSLAEVVDARIGVLDSTTYQTLGARLNAEFQRLSNALSGITILESTGDITDRTSEILSKLNAYGVCKLGKGDFYVSSLVMPEDSMLIGSGNSTRIILPSSVTSGYVVKPRSNCIIENISFYGVFTGTYSELIASGADAKRHCIILDRFDSVNSENVILSNIFINNFVGSAIIQRYTVGCHCKDVVINMCYAGIDISNTSYDGQCTNVYMNDTRYGVVQNGSNFVFSGCISKDSEYHIMSDQQNTECTFSSCTFFDSSLETTSKLAILSNARNGFVFDSCMFDSSLKIGLIACDGIVIKGTNFVGSDTFKIIVQNGRNTLLLITDCIADVEPVVTNAGTAARITSCYLKDGTAWSISSEVDITVDDELSDESENPVQNKVINRAVSEIKADLGDLSGLETESKSNLVSAVNDVNKNLEHTIFDTILLESGTYSDANGTTKTARNSRLRNTRPFLADDINSITLPSGYSMWIYRLDKSFGLISAVVGWRSGTINISDIFVSGMKYINFVIRNNATQSSDISGQCQTVQDGMKYEKLSVSNIRNIDDIKNILIDGYIDYNDALVQGTYINAGVLNSVDYRIRLPEIVFVPAGTSIIINPGSLKKAYTIWKGSISRDTVVKSTSFTDGIEEISIEDDRYFMVAFAKSDDSSISPSEFDGTIYIKNSLPYRNKVAISRIGRKYTIPDYYMTDDYILNKINRINALGKESDDVFIFITDIHWGLNAKQSPALINYIMRRCGISKVFDGGDFADAVDKTALDIYKDAVIGEIHHATGNHDWFPPETGKSIYYAFDYDKNNQYGVFDKHYYYYDNVQAKIRYVVLNPFIHTGSDLSNGWDIEYKADQITWLRDTALNVPDGYDVVIITHYYATNSSSVTGVTAIESVINTFNDSGNGKVLFVCEGHRHWDAVFTNGFEVPIVLTTCDKYDVSNEPTLSGYVREKGTISEQAFDVVFINRDTHTATFIRIGAKAMDNNNISIGETGFTLTGTLEERTITIL